MVFPFVLVLGRLGVVVCVVLGAGRVVVAAGGVVMGATDVRGATGAVVLTGVLVGVGDATPVATLGARVVRRW